MRLPVSALSWQARCHALACLLAAALLVVVPAGCGSSPTSPDPPPKTGLGSLAGTWQGTIDTVAGRGTLTLTLAAAPASDSRNFTGYNGTWSASFSDRRFSAEGIASAGHESDASVATVAALLLGPAPVPCPGEPAGVGNWARSATFLLADRTADYHLHARYSAAPCPGGEIEIWKK